MKLELYTNSDIPISTAGRLVFLIKQQLTNFIILWWFIFTQSTPTTTRALTSNWVRWRNLSFLKVPEPLSPLIREPLEDVDEGNCLIFCKNHQTICSHLITSEEFSSLGMRGWISTSGFSFHFRVCTSKDTKFKRKTKPSPESSVRRFGCKNCYQYGRRWKINF